MATGLAMKGSDEAREITDSLGSILDLAENLHNDTRIDRFTRHSISRLVTHIKDVQYVWEVAQVKNSPTSEVD